MNVTLPTISCNVPENAVQFGLGMSGTGVTVELWRDLYGMKWYVRTPDGAVEIMLAPIVDAAILEIQK